MAVQIVLQKMAISVLRHFLLGTVSLSHLDHACKDDLYRYPTLIEKISTPEAVRMNFAMPAKTVQASVYETPKIVSLQLKNIYFCPEYNVLHTQARQIIQESLSTQKDLEQFELRAFYHKEIETIPNICSLFRSHKNGYYHTLIDNVPRLYLLRHPRLQKLDEIKIIYANELTPVEQFYLSKLLPHNAKLTQVDSSKLYLLENLIFPSFLSRRFSGYLPTEYRKWFMSKVVPQRSRKKVNRIFISRTATHKGRQRCIINEDELFEVLQPHGFKRYVLEHLSIEAQISLFYDAEAVVAAHGAGLANTLFSKNIKIIELFPTASVIPHYYFLAKSLGHSYRYWCAHEKDDFDNFIANVSEIRRIFEDL